VRKGPSLLIRDGELIIENARRQLITRAEIQEKLRDKGISSMNEVREGRLEADGNFSVLRESG